MPDGHDTAQINLKLPKDQFATICAAAERHHVAPMRYCIDLVLSAPETLSVQPGGTLVKTLRPGEMSKLVQALDRRVADLHSAVRELASRIHTNSLATLEQVLAVRLILQNLAAATFTGQGEMAELRALANDSAPQLASEILADLAARLSDGAGTDTHPGTEPERSTTNG